MRSAKGTSFNKNMKISYVLPTKNKLPYLKITLGDLILNRADNEEIVVIDGGSTDGTKEFLDEAFQKGKIQKFISEQDFGESHGVNKGWLLADGDIIKPGNRRCLFSFSVIRQGAEFMIKNPQIDLVMTNGCKSTLPSKKISNFSYEASFESWRDAGKPFAFCGLGMLLRKKSLPLLGLLDTSYIRTDEEYALRVTTNKKIQIALYTRAMYFHVANKNSNTNTMNEKFHAETKRLAKIYGKQKNVSFLKKIAGKIKRTKTTQKEESFSDMEEGYTYYQKWLANENAKNNGQFLYKK